MNAADKWDRTCEACRDNNCEASCNRCPVSGNDISTATILVKVSFNDDGRGHKQIK